MQWKFPAAVTVLVIVLAPSATRASDAYLCPASIAAPVVGGAPKGWRWVSPLRGNIRKVDGVGVSDLGPDLEAISPVFTRRRKGRVIKHLEFSTLEFGLWVQCHYSDIGDYLARSIGAAYRVCDAEQPASRSSPMLNGHSRPVFRATCR
jgi:hypothetical protein